MKDLATAAISIALGLNILMGILISRSSWNSD